jgi:hypothetical protein
VVSDGPVKENIVKGADINLYDFPAPQWNRVDGGRYILTYAGCVTKDPVTGVMNVGIYRGMMASALEIPILMWRAQHIGHHVTAWQQTGAKEMPIAFVIGWEDSLGFCAGSPVAKGVCEFDADPRVPQGVCDSGRMTNQTLHDALLKENRIAIEMMRASLTNQKLSRDFASTWKFYGATVGR